MPLGMTNAAQLGLTGRSDIHTQATPKMLNPLTRQHNSRALCSTATNGRRCQ